MRLTFYGAARTVTGSCYLLEHTGHKILIDCGLFQGSKALKERNYTSFPFDPQEINLVLLTHAHIDHSGLLPKLFKEGYAGQVICTHGTEKLCSIMLPDSGYIQEMEVERKNRKNMRSGKPLLEPIYTAADAKYCLDHFRGINYETWFSPLKGVNVCLHDAGHILGSAIIELKLETDHGTISLAFSGDLGGEGQPIVRDPHRLTAVDYLVMESTYGNRRRKEQIENEKLEQLAGIITATFERGGNVIIPAFAVERTQDLLYYLGLLILQGRIDERSIYIDSPLAISATEIFRCFPEYYDAEIRALERESGVSPLDFPNLNFSRSVEESVALNKIRQGAIIISASGMCDAGRIKHHLKHNLWREKCTVLLVGYQAEGTLGRRLLEGVKKVRIHGEEVAVRAKIKNLEGFSSHADQEGLLSWVSTLVSKPRMIFLTHGEENSLETLSDLINNRLSIKTKVPQWLETVDLDTGTVAKAAPSLMAEFEERIIKGNFELLQQELQQWFERILSDGAYEPGMHKIEELRSRLPKE